MLFTGKLRYKKNKKKKKPQERRKKKKLKRLKPHKNKLFWASFEPILI